MQYIVMIAVFYQIILVIGDNILLGGFKICNEVLDKLVLGAIFVGNGADGYLILDDIH